MQVAREGALCARTEVARARAAFTFTRTFAFAVALATAMSATMVACGGDTPAAPVVVGTVTVLPATASVAVGAKVQLSAEVRATTGQVLTDRAVSWTSADVSKAVVTEAGLVTGIAVGTVQITATSEGKSATAAVSVTLGPCDVSRATPIVANVLMNGTLANTDCDLDDGTFLDVYGFVLNASTNVDILMRSPAFDAYLSVLKLTSSVLTEQANDNNSGGGTDARLTGLLTAGSYFILANSFNAGGFGAYTLLLTSPYAGLHAEAALFSDRHAPIVLHRLTPAQSRSVRAFAHKQ